MFLDLAKSWTDLAAIFEGAEELLDPASPPANDPGEPYRFSAQEVKVR
jgi:hypothetical protein